jgi:tetratricopeptide (TPR) repeat protein
MFRNWPLGLLGRLGELDEALPQAIELTREQEVLGFLSWGLAIRVFHGEWSGNIATALTSARQAVEVAERSGASFFLSIALAWLGDALRLERHYEEALEVYQRTLDLIHAKRVAFQWRPVVIAGQAQIHSALGEHERAIAQARAALEEALPGGNRFGESVARVALARVLLAAGEQELQEEIEQCLDLGEGLCRETGMRIHHPPLLEVRAALAERRGDAQEARRILREAHRLYTEMGATGHAERLAEELEP